MKPHHEALPRHLAGDVGCEEKSLISFVFFRVLP